jgi:hypothetical protein
VQVCAFPALTVTIQSAAAMAAKDGSGTLTSRSVVLNKSPLSLSRNAAEEAAKNQSNRSACALSACKST